MVEKDGRKLHEIPANKEARGLGKLAEEKWEKSEGIWSGGGQDDPQQRSQPA
ncbi:hypothetical protein T458_08105 [Brevibacillus panacihumi W25]|uniref:Uncharacterized protein n=1 Tax=Brevibacillus panacihumi W25 TaxID=1408254 RepID=V6MBI8_9BACL|nr:hypothetical protein T458_08105 [Brevibacillus panacihumi W25]